MQVRRGFLIALALAVLTGVAGVVVAGGRSSDPEAAQIKAVRAAQALARKHLPAAMAALHRLRVPADFRRLTIGCHWYRCYVVSQPASRVAPVLPSIMRSIGADNPKTRRLDAELGVRAAPLQSEPMLKHLGIRAQASRVEGCATGYNRRHGVWVHCDEPAVIDDNIVSVFLGPHFACGASPSHCRWTNQTEVDITEPSGARQTAHQ